MGFNFGEFFEEAGKKAQAALDDAVKVGTPAIKASLEQWGIDTLTRQQKETQKELNAVVKDLQSSDPAPGSFAAAFSATMKNSVLQNNGLLICGVVAGLVFVGFMMKGK